MKKKNWNNTAGIAGGASIRIARWVMMALVAACVAWATPHSVLSERITRPINDFANVLTPEHQQRMEAISNAVWQRLQVAIVVVTVTDLEGTTIEDLATKLYQTIGIGDKRADDGALILLARKDREIRIESGYGAEGYLTDVQASAIIRAAETAYLSKNLWDEGLFQMQLAVAELAAKNSGVPLKEIIAEQPRLAPAPQSSNGRSSGWNIGVLAPILLLLLLGTPMGRSMLPWLLLAAMSSGRRSYHGSSGGFGGGFGGGGFGGFGGGMSGGGGASGRF